MRSARARACLASRMNLFRSLGRRLHERPFSGQSVARGETEVTGEEGAGEVGGLGLGAGEIAVTCDTGESAVPTEEGGCTSMEAMVEARSSVRCVPSEMCDRASLWCPPSLSLPAPWSLRKVRRDKTPGCGLGDRSSGFHRSWRQDPSEEALS